MSPDFILAGPGNGGTDDRLLSSVAAGRRAHAACSCDTLKAVNRSGHKDVTLSLPETLLRRFRVYAASRNQSMTRLMADAIREIMDRDADSVRAKRRFLDRIEHAPDRGTGGVIRWSRQELHER